MPLLHMFHSHTLNFEDLKRTSHLHASHVSFFSRTMKMRGPFAGVLPFNRIEPAANLLREGVLVQFSSEFTVGPGPFGHLARWLAGWPAG